jgi:putative transposase
MLDEEELHLPDSRHRGQAPADSELLYAKRWVLYAKRHFGGPHQSYLAKYTRCAALTNRRIIAIDAKRRTVTFTNRDYLHGSQLK